MSATEGKIVSKLAAEASVSVGSPAALRVSPLLAHVMRWAVVLLVLIVALDVAASLLVSRRSVRQRLDARLAASIGRPVEVDGYSFSLWGGPTLEAAGVMVGEDPRFGYEYYLRADALAVRLRWSSLLRGRIELGTLLLTGPTLNVEENAAGQWNLAEWLGHPIAPGQGAVRPQPAPFVPRLRKIQVEGGRVNFKRGNEKLPFAFVDVTGTIESDGGERWQVNLETSPWRAAAILQQAGTIHLSGNIGGTSSALRPADLQIAWTDASLSDFLRLVRGDDQGVRGRLALAMNAHAGGDNWSLEGRAQLSGLHRWDLAERPDNPSVNVTAKMALDLAASNLQITQAVLDAPRSNAQAHGTINWGSGDKAVPRARAKSEPAAGPAAVEITSASIDMSDLLASLRAFRPGTPDGLDVRGNVRAHGTLSGWPPKAGDAMVTSTGADLSGGGLRAPIRVGPLQVNYGSVAHGSDPAGAGLSTQHLLTMAPTTITIDEPSQVGLGRRADPRPLQGAGSFRVELALPAQVRGRASAQGGLHITGGSADVSELIAAASAFGWNVSHGGDLSGPWHADLRWAPVPSSGAWPWQTPLSGSVSVGGAGDDAAILRVPFLNLPVSGVQARLDWTPGSRRVTLASAQAFGTYWSGTFDRADSDSQWSVALAAGSLNSEDLDRWLNPRWRESLIDRVLPFLNSPAGPGAAAEGLRATGYLSVEEFIAAPFTIDHLQATLKIDGRHLTFGSATGQLAGGKLTGDLDAELDAAPAYSAHATFSGVNLVPLSNASSAAALFSGAASGQIEFAIQGASRQDLFDSLRCAGSLDVRDAAWRGTALSESLAAVAPVPGSSVFRHASADFTCGNQTVALKNIELAGAGTKIEGSGAVDFSRDLSLQLRLATGNSAAQAADAGSGASILVTGTPDAPKFTPALASRRAR
jgi:hypothetical protein